MVIRPRLLYVAPALACVGLLGCGYYLQYFDSQDPCPLCLVQRGFYYGILFLFTIAALHLPGRTGNSIYGSAAALLALGGFGVAARQVWLQHLPTDQVPACGPDLYFMLENFPLARMLEKLFTGSGQCAEVNWTFLGLSIAGWSLLCFAALAIYALWLTLRGRNTVHSS
ncbi:MAG: disulfide bond formation protein B [Betaproteobacteria bacterium]|nr:disulfide bond formation protein B [Betaproteobacteria bacterium]MSQ87843.1 disulfide bond formation protein B [Betaproteobacteria bacterium]